MATKKYTVTLPEELAEEIRSEVGPGAFSAYVTEAVQRKRENDRLGELVEWMVEGQEPFTEAELAEADTEFRDIQRSFAESARRRESAVPEAPETTDAAPASDAAVTSGTADAETDHPLAA